MIVCSCNVLSDHQLRSTLAQLAPRPRMSQIYARLGASAQCGRCVRSVKRIMQEVASRAIASVAVRDAAHENAATKHGAERMRPHRDAA